MRCTYPITTTATITIATIGAMVKNVPAWLLIPVVALAAGVPGSKASIAVVLILAAMLFYDPARVLTAQGP